MKSVFLMPGQLHVATEPTLITTMLGSCVGVFLFDEEAKTAGLNHFVLSELRTGEEESNRFGQPAMRNLLRELIQAGAQVRRLQARIFGGGAVLKGVQLGDGIGKRNIELARRFLADQGIRVIEDNTGGERGRKIVCNTQSFSVEHHLVGQEVELSGFSKAQALIKVKVGIVDDSATVRSLFAKVFERAEGIEVVGVAASAFEAREMIVNSKPDVITLDIEMPQMSGVQFLEKLMRHLPIPTVMVSSLDANGAAALRAMELGAIEFVHKPSQFDPAALRSLAETLIPKVRAAASTRVQKVKREVSGSVAVSSPVGTRPSPRLIGVTGNTGGPAAVSELLGALRMDDPPTVIAVSTLGLAASEFVERERKRRLAVDIKLASEGRYSLTSGCAFVLAGGYQADVRSEGGSLVLVVSRQGPVLGHAPSGDVLLESMSRAVGRAGVALVVSGFGHDGVKGCEAVSAAGGAVLVQDPSEAAFAQTPQNVINEGLATAVGTLPTLISWIEQARNASVLGGAARRGEAS